MGFKKVNFINERTGVYKTAPVGFSWTTFFFGIIPALFRGDWKWAGIGFLLNSITFGFFTVVFSFGYNKVYMKDLLKSGFVPATQEECDFLVRKGVSTREEMEFLNSRR